MISARDLHDRRRTHDIRQGKENDRELLKQEPISDSDSVVFMIVGTRREKMTNGEPMPAECNESVFVPGSPPTWLCTISAGVTGGAVCERYDIQLVREVFYRVIADPDLIGEYRTVALKVYKETRQGNAQGFQMRWEFVADLDAYHND